MIIPDRSSYPETRLISDLAPLRPYPANFDNCYDVPDLAILRDRLLEAAVYTRPIRYGCQETQRGEFEAVRYSAGQRQIDVCGLPSNYYWQ